MKTIPVGCLLVVCVCVCMFIGMSVVFVSCVCVFIGMSNIVQCMLILISVMSCVHLASQLSVMSDRNFKLDITGKIFNQIMSYLPCV